jgi:hypothetical protein
MDYKIEKIVRKQYVTETGQVESMVIIYYNVADIFRDTVELPEAQATERIIDIAVRDELANVKKLCAKLREEGAL